MLVSFRFYFLKMLSFSLVFISFSVSFSLLRNMGYLSRKKGKKKEKIINDNLTCECTNGVTDPHKGPFGS